VKKRFWVLRVVQCAGLGFLRAPGLVVLALGWSLIIPPGVSGAAMAPTPEAGHGNGSPAVSRGIQLVELVEKKDYVEYDAGPSQQEINRRKGEEQEKERQSWDMLKNMIIDGRRPPLRFSDPPARSGN
jgi:hypothetical protein